MDNGLDTSFNASNIVTHGVEAGLGWVDLNDLFQLDFAAGELVFPELALGLAFLHNEGLRILTLLEHSGDVVGLGDVRGKSRLGGEGPTRGQPSNNSTSHYYKFMVLIITLTFSIHSNRSNAFPKLYQPVPKLRM